MILRGWKEIEAFTGFHRSTIRRWVKKKGFPLLPGHGVSLPMSSHALINLWLAQQIEKKNNSHENK